MLLVHFRHIWGARLVQQRHPVCFVKMALCNSPLTSRSGRNIQENWTLGGQKEEDTLKSHMEIIFVSVTFLISLLLNCQDT